MAHFYREIRSVLGFGLLAVTVVGCGAFMNVMSGKRNVFIPGDIKGDVPVVIENTASTELCYFYMNRVEGKPNNQNLLTDPSTALKPTETEHYTLKAMTYSVQIESCVHDLKPRIAALTISGPTYLVVGDGQPRSVPAGYTVVRATAQASTACVDPGFDMGGGPCCSGQHRYELYGAGGGGREVCQ